MNEYNYTYQGNISDFEDDSSDYISTAIKAGFWLALALVNYSINLVLVLPFKVIYDKRYDITSAFTLISSHTIITDL